MGTVNAGALMWVEVLDRHGEVAARYRFDDIARYPVRVGRAPDNDIVLDDPHVAPHHAVIAMDREGHLYADDTGTINGLINESNRERAARIDFRQQPLIRLGKTRIRVRDGRAGTELIAPEKPLLHELASGRQAIALALVLLAVAFLDLWTNFIGDSATTHFLFPIMMVALFILLWTSAWALVSRIFAGQVWYFRHLVVALAVAVGAVFFSEGREWLAYALAWPALEEQDIVSFWLFIALACYGHFSVMAVKNMRLAMGLISLALVTVIALQWVALNETRKYMGQQATLGTLKPPAFRLRSPEAVSGFLSRTEAVKSALDAARKKEPEQGGFSDFED